MAKRIDFLARLLQILKIILQILLSSRRLLLHVPQRCPKLNAIPNGIERVDDVSLVWFYLAVGERAVQSLLEINDLPIHLFSFNIQLVPKKQPIGFLKQFEYLVLNLRILHFIILN